ncbi:MAG: FAD-dependent oxidoreductase [Alphaproteobacteria bacterium]
MSRFDHDVAIIGAGPAGIAAATALANAGVRNIVVFEREAQIGGIARHCHHPSFGLLVFKRPMAGPSFIRAIVRRCPNVRFETGTTILAFRPGGALDLATPAGLATISARHVVLATGARETPRHPRLVSGLRPLGVTTTGALQQILWGERRPFRRPVIVGTELVSFSGLWTLKRAGARPAAMIEENSRITAHRPAALFAHLLRVPIKYNSRIIDIGGAAKTEFVVVENSAGKRQRIACDGVIFSGKFVGENALARASHLGEHLPTQLPQVDQNWVSSDPGVSIIGNATHPADMGDQCYIEGLAAGRNIAGLLAGKFDCSGPVIAVSHDTRTKMTTPNCVHLNANGATKIEISLHVMEAFTGAIVVRFCGQIVYRKFRRCLPARRITLKNISLDQVAGAEATIDVSLEI